jgi:hypothetical protein
MSIFESNRERTRGRLAAQYENPAPRIRVTALGDDIFFATGGSLYPVVLSSGKLNNPIHPRENCLRAAGYGGGFSAKAL